MVLDSSESKIIQYIYKRYLELTKRGHSKTKVMRLLRKSLQGKDYKYKGKDFTSHTLRYILSNNFYTGVLTHGDKQTKHNYETIISPRLYNLINRV